MEATRYAVTIHERSSNARRSATIPGSAVAYLAGQQPTAYTHELVVTPAGDRWVP